MEKNDKHQVDVTPTPEQQPSKPKMTLWQSVKNLMVRLFGFGKKKKAFNVLTEEEIMSPTKQTVRKFFRNKIAIVGLAMFILIVFFIGITSVTLDFDASYNEVSQIYIRPGVSNLKIPSGLKKAGVKIVADGYGKEKPLIGSGVSFTVAIGNNDKLYVWGADYERVKSVPKEIKEIVPRVKQLAVGSSHVMLLTDDNKLYGWGKNNYGQAGRLYYDSEIDFGTQEEAMKTVETYFDPAARSKYPEALVTKAEIDPIKHLFAGFEYTGILTEAGYLIIWGNTNTRGISKPERSYDFFKLNFNVQGDDLVWYYSGARHQRHPVANVRDYEAELALPAVKYEEIKWEIYRDNLIHYYQPAQFYDVVTTTDEFMTKYNIPRQGTLDIAVESSYGNMQWRYLQDETVYPILDAATFKSALGIEYEEEVFIDYNVSDNKIYWRPAGSQASENREIMALDAFLTQYNIQAEVPNGRVHIYLNVDHDLVYEYRCDTTRKDLKNASGNVIKTTDLATAYSLPKVNGRSFTFSTKDSQIYYGFEVNMGNYGTPIPSLTYEKLAGEGLNYGQEGFTVLFQMTETGLEYKKIADGEAPEAVAWTPYTGITVAELEAEGVVFVPGRNMQLRNTGRGLTFGYESPNKNSAPIYKTAEQLLADFPAAESTVEIVYPFDGGLALVDNHGRLFLSGGTSSQVEPMPELFNKTTAERGGLEIVDFKASVYNAAALLSNGRVYVWGQTGGANELPAAVTQAKVVQLSAGRHHFNALTDQGEVYAWGSSNKLKQLDVPKIKEDVKFISSRYFLSQAITAEGKLINWGHRGYLFGSTATGASLFERVAIGGKMTMLTALIAVAVSLAIGVVMGLIAGFYGGWVDQLIMRFAEIISSFPFLPLAMTLSVFATQVGMGEQTRIYFIMCILGFLSWTGLARMIRGQILAEREKDFVLAAKALGIRERNIIIRHILPSVINIVIVSTTLSYAGSLLTESGLSFLGFGVRYPEPSWGNLLTGAQSMSVLKYYWWVWIIPASFVVMTALSVNLIGDGLRDAMDPKSSER